MKKHVWNQENQKKPVALLTALALVVGLALPTQWVQAATTVGDWTYDATTGTWDDTTTDVVETEPGSVTVVHYYGDALEVEEDDYNYDADNNYTMKWQLGVEQEMIGGSYKDLWYVEDYSTAFTAQLYVDGTESTTYTPVSIDTSGLIELTGNQFPPGSALSLVYNDEANAWAYPTGTVTGCPVGMNAIFEVLYEGDYSTLEALLDAEGYDTSNLQISCDSMEIVAGADGFVYTIPEASRVEFPNSYDTIFTAEVSGLTEPTDAIYVTFPATYDKYMVYVDLTSSGTQIPTGSKVAVPQSSVTGGYTYYVGLDGYVAKPAYYVDNLDGIVTVKHNGTVVEGTPQSGTSSWDVPFLAQNAVYYSLTPSADATVAISLEESRIMPTPTVPLQIADSAWEVDVTLDGVNWPYTDDDTDVLTPDYTYDVTLTYNGTGAVQFLGDKITATGVSDIATSGNNIAFKLTPPTSQSGDLDVTVHYTVEAVSGSDYWYNETDGLWYDVDDLTTPGQEPSAEMESTTVGDAQWNVSGSVSDGVYTGQLNLNNLDSWWIWDYSDFEVTVGGTTYGVNADGTFTLDASACPPGTTFTVDTTTPIEASTPEISVSGTTTGCVYDAGIEGGTLFIYLTVEAEYADNVPTLTVDGQTMTVEDSYASTQTITTDAVQYSPGGGALSAYSVQYADSAVNYVFSLDVGEAYYPTAYDAMTVVISGLGSEDTSSGGGGGGGGSDTTEEEIRVSNDTENADSNTTLWPADNDTVTDAEIDALIALVEAHRDDVEGSAGDPLIEAIIKLETPSKGDTYAVSLTVEQVNKLEGAQVDRFTVKTPCGAVSVYGDTLKELSDTNKTLKFSITPDGDSATDVTITYGGTDFTYTQTPYGIRVFIPYELQAGQDVSSLVIEYIHEDGTREFVKECFYSQVEGGLVFYTNHLSKFGVTYSPTAVADVPTSHWANPYVTFLASRGIIDSGKFRPDEAITRAEAVDMVSSALDLVSLPTSALSVYGDVSTSSAVATAITWVYYNNLLSAITNNGNFQPNSAISREDMALLVGNVSTALGLRMRSLGLDTGYTDNASIASYAQDPVTKLTAAGVLSVTENYKFSPKSNVTRGEMAQIVAMWIEAL